MDKVWKAYKKYGIIPIIAVIVSENVKSVIHPNGCDTPWLKLPHKLKQK